MSGENPNKDGKSKNGQIPKKKQTAWGVDPLVLGGLFVEKMSTLNYKNYLNPDGVLDSDSMGSDARDLIAKAIREHIKNNLYYTGNYTGVLPSGSPDKVGPYNFEVESINITGSAITAVADSYARAIGVFEQKLSSEIALNLKFKSTDATGYLNINAPYLTVMPGSVYIRIPKNTTGENKTQGDAMDLLAKAIIHGLKSTKLSVPSYVCNSSAGGSGTWVPIKAI